MGLKKGQCNNLSGRKTGSKNKNTVEIRTALKTLLDSNVPQMEADLKKLSPKERLTVMLKLCEFVVPKIQPIPGEDSKTDNEIIIRIVE